MEKKRAINDERGPERNRHNNLDQLGPKALRAQGANEDLISADISSYPLILLTIPAESIRQGKMELKTDKEDVNRSKGNEPNMEFVEETTKDLQWDIVNI